MAILEGAAAITAVKNALDIVRSVRGSNDAAKLKAAINDLTINLSDALTEILSLQQQVAACEEAKRKIEAKQAQTDSWPEKAAGYVRKQSRGGAFVYVEKNPGEGNSSGPSFCAHCFEEKKISVLQPLGIMGMSKCPTCASHVKTGDG